MRCSRIGMMTAKRSQQNGRSKTVAAKRSQQNDREKTSASGQAFP
jgi:hypothetical protein